MNIEEFDYSVNLFQALLWQYTNSPKINSLLTQKQQWYNVNQEAFWRTFYDDVFNLLTANQFGIAVWNIILNVPLFLSSGVEPFPPTGTPIFGFQDHTIPWVTDDNENFFHSNFSDLNSSIVLSLQEQRLLLRLRYYQLTCRVEIPALNEFLDYLFGTSGEGLTGQVYVVDNLDMTITYFFNFPISPILVQVMQGIDILPRPAGVAVITTII